MEQNLQITFPLAAEMKAAMPEESCKIMVDENRLEKYFPEIEKLLLAGAKRGEHGIVIKFEVEDYTSEEECKAYISATGKILETFGYRCCVSLDTYALACKEGGIDVSVMRNPKIIAMTVMWCL